MLFNDCDFVKSFGDILNSEILDELRNRNSACSNYGRRLICCEKSFASNQQLALNPVTQPSTTTTERIVQDSLNPTPIRFQGDPTQHPNYNLFKDLKCGSSYSNRVANGKDCCLTLLTKSKKSFNLSIKVKMQNYLSFHGQPDWDMTI